MITLLNYQLDLHKSYPISKTPMWGENRASHKPPTKIKDHDDFYNHERLGR